jgi:hypothetical protein
MVWQVPTDGRPKLLKTVRTFFLSKGWAVKDLERTDARTDFIIKNRELTYFITVVDEAQNRFFPMGRMIDGMTKDSREIRALKRQTLAYVLNFRFQSISFESLAERGISAFALDEMDKLAGTAAYQDALPPPLGIREKALLVGNPKACISISGKFQKSGDRASAIEWAKYAIALKGGVSVAHTRLFEMYLEEGDLESADRVGQEVFYFQPSNAEFLSRMEKLAIKRQDPEAAALYRARRAPDKLATVAPRSFEDLIKKQQARRSLSNASPAEPPAVDAKPERTPIDKLLHRLRGSSGRA